MNTQQRNYLIKKIEESVKIRVDALKSSEPQPPSLSNFLLHAVMSGTFEIRSNEEIKEMIRQKALTSKDRDDWMGNSWGNASKDKIIFQAKDFFIIPEEYQKRWDEYREKRKAIWDEVASIQSQADGLVTRITLASDKTLQTMINEVDDMGNISLMDTKLKLLTGGAK